MDEPNDIFFLEMKRLQCIIGAEYDDECGNRYSGPGMVDDAKTVAGFSQLASSHLLHEQISAFSMHVSYNREGCVVPVAALS